VAMAAFFWGNRLLPAGIAGRPDWEIHLFFAVWLLMLFHASVRPVRRAWTEQFGAAAVLCATLPLWNLLAGKRHLLAAIREADWVFAGFELALLAAAAMFAAIAMKTARVGQELEAKPRVTSGGIPG
jgi:hypothetical protein